MGAVCTLSVSKSNTSGTLKCFILKRFRIASHIVILTGSIVLSHTSIAQVPVRLERLPAPGVPGFGQGPLGMVEIQGVEAGSFRVSDWRHGTLHWVRDVRYPLLSPQMGGPFRNIYSPSAVAEPWGWRLYYSGWDGMDTPHDRVYECTTKNFIDFADRHMTIDHGVFMHVSNVSVQQVALHDYKMLATAAITYPGPMLNTNKPVEFSSSNGDTWDGDTVPHQAKASELIVVNGYPEYDRADLNGANVLFSSAQINRLYFSDWRRPGNVYWAEGESVRNLDYRGIALKTYHAANDLRVFETPTGPVYLMGLYKKGDVGLTASDSNHLWYSLSNDGHTFSPEKPLISAQGDLDRFIFSVGFVKRGNQMLGVLYGGGSVATDDRNQLFATWLQKRLVLTAKPGFIEGNGAEYEAKGALGPDRQWVELPDAHSFDGFLTVYAEDGLTRLGSIPVHLEPGSIYRIIWQ